MKKHTLFLFSSFVLTPMLYAADPVKVEVTCNDQMQFSTKTLEATAGQPIAITVKNIGKLPVEAMGHNMVILKPGSEITAFAMKAMTAKDSAYIPADPEIAKMVVAHSKLLGPGEMDTITFTPTEAGTYPYLCSFPGHFGVMQGLLTVK
ncbi:MAG: Azurin [Akkermansiaceae bacterium]|nr:Azurin [Akkermansiaceae bacterium]